MKGLPTLMKLRRHELDEKSKVLQQISNRINEIEDMISNMNAEMKNEIELTKENSDYSLAWRGYFDSVKAKQVLLRQKIKSLEQSLLRAQDEVRTAFQNTKSIEILSDKLADEAKTEELKREMKELEDLVIQKRAR